VPNTIKSVDIQQSYWTNKKCAVLERYSAVAVHCVSKNTPILASYSFGKHGLLLIFFDKRHQHTSKNDIHAEMSLSLQFYLLYLLVNTFDENDAFWRHSVLVKQSISFGRKYLTLSLQICVRETVRLTTEFVDWCRNACTLYTNTPPRHQPLSPATWSSASLTHHMGKHITERHRRSSWSIEKAVTCKREGKMTLLWTFAKLKPALFRANALHNWIFSGPPTGSDPAWQWVRPTSVLIVRVASRLF